MGLARTELVVLAIDLGSSSIRTALFDQAGAILVRTMAQREYAIRYTPDGGAELSPAILRRAADGCLAETLRGRRDSPRLRTIPIAAIGGSSFWHGLLGLDRAGRPVTPIFTWADYRSGLDARLLRAELSEAEIHGRTGCMLRASYWPAKLRWLRRTQPRLFERVVRWASPAQWIFCELFGAATSSHSMASGTGLYNLEEGA